MVLLKNVECGIILNIEILVILNPIPVPFLELMAFKVLLKQQVLQSMVLHTVNTEVDND